MTKLDKCPFMALFGTFWDYENNTTIQGLESEPIINHHNTITHFSSIVYYVRIYRKDLGSRFQAEHVWLKKCNMVDRTYHSTASRVQQQAFPWSQIGHLKEEQVSHHVVGGNSHGVQWGHARWQLVHIDSWHGDQLSPCLVFRQSHDDIADLGTKKKSKYR